MTDNQQATSSDPDADALDRPLTLAVLRQLVRSDWRGLPGATLIVLSRDVEGNGYSPFATYSRARYAPTYDFVGEVYPLPEELEQDKELRELFADGIPDSAVPGSGALPARLTGPARGGTAPRGCPAPSHESDVSPTMSASAQAHEGEARPPVLVISDSLDDDPLGLLPCPVPLRHLPSPLFSPEEYQAAPLVLLDDRSYADFTLRHMPRRAGLIVAVADPDDGTAYPRAAAIGAEAVIRAGHGRSWLHLRLHAATDCRYAHWDSLLTGGPADPPPPASS
jgi:hypothetical protein